MENHLQILEKTHFQALKKNNMIFLRILVVSIILILNSCMLGPEYKLSESEQNAISLIEDDCGCVVRVHGDVDELPEEEKKGCFTISLRFNKSNINFCKDFDSIQLMTKSEEYLLIFNSMGDKFKENHTSIVFDFYSSIYPNERMEVVNCEKRFVYSLDSLKLIKTKFRETEAWD